MYAARKQWKLEQVDVQLRLNPEGTPASGNLIERQITLQGALDDEQRQRLLQVAERSEEHTSELQSPCNLVCRLLLEIKHSDISDESKNYLDESGITTACLRIK